MRVLALACGLLLAASPALAGPVTLRANPVDDDGRVTFGDVFDGAGAASDTVIAGRAGPSVVFEAGQLQGLALRAGLQWSNPTGLRRVVVRQGAGQATTAVAAASPTAARPGATVEVLAYARNINAGDVVQAEDVIWSTVQAHQTPSGAPQAQPKLSTTPLFGSASRPSARRGAVSNGAGGIGRTGTRSSPCGGMGAMPTSSPSTVKLASTGLPLAASTSLT